MDACVALTHNYVSTSNLSDCLQFLREKKEQISGLRDRLAQGAVPPEQLYDCFVEKLADNIGTEKMALYIQQSFKGLHISVLTCYVVTVIGVFYCCIYGILDHTAKNGKRKAATLASQNQHKSRLVRGRQTPPLPSDSEEKLGGEEDSRETVVSMATSLEEKEAKATSSNSMATNSGNFLFQFIL